MRLIKEPEVFLISRPALDWNEISRYLNKVGGEEWNQNREHEWEDSAQDLIEFMGRLCYKSWKPGLNPNVTKIRTEQSEYLRNIILTKHGSVLEHANYSFVFLNVSRVFTHELCRHRAGTAISQESMRYVRLTDIPMWIPGWDNFSEEIRNKIQDHVVRSEILMLDMTKEFGLDNPKLAFSFKKAMTSFMRRFIPDGVATSIGWTANIRALRHIIELRTSTGVEEEIRLMFDKIAYLMKEECPLLFDDFKRDEQGQWIPEASKV